MLDSVVNQTYDNWQICLADGGGDGFTVEKTVQPYIDRFGADRVRYVKLKDNLGIAENTNAALRLADGDYIVFGDHDDELHPTAFFECMRELERYPEADLIYSDEDKIIEASGKHTEAHFKSDLNMELLRRNNYICHLCVVKKSLVDEVGELKTEYNGSQDHDYVLRCVEKARCVRHIPRILYHWRINDNSTAKSASTKTYANTAGVNAVSAHLERIGLDGKVTNGVAPGFYDIAYKLEGEPFVSVIIPNKDHLDDLTRCIESMENVNNYHNIEYIVVENNSVLDETFAGYETMEKKYGDRFRLVKWDGGFNYSAINNYGIQYAKGEYILLLNNDTEVISPRWIEEMLMYAQQDRVGCVGAKLLYPDNTIQHAGIGFGFLTLAAHMHKNFPVGHPGYMGRLVYAQDVYAVTAACLMVRKSVYEQVNGLDESFAVAFNDVDFCVRVREAGYTNVFTPFAQLYHYESKSRGLDENPVKRKRFISEVERFQKRWAKQLAAGDPCMNPNFDLMKEDFSFDIKPLE